MAIQYVLNPWAFISLFAFVVSLVLGLMILKKNPSGRLNRAYAILAFGLSMWALGETMVRFIAESPASSESHTMALYFSRFAFGFVIISTFTLIHFTLILIRFKSKILKSKVVPLVLFGCGMALTLVAWFTPLITSDVKWTWFGYTGVRAGNIGYNVFLGVYIFLVLFITISVIKGIRTSKNVIEKSQLLLALIGLLSVLVIGGIGQVLLPIIGRDIPTGTITTIVMGVCFAYDMLKYNLFEIKAVTEEAPIELRQRLEPGFNYIVKERDTRNTYEIFRGVVSTTPGLCLTTFHPKKLRKEYGLEKTPIIWLTETETPEKRLSPIRLEFEILYTIESFVKENEKTTILIDDLNYLTMTNNFEGVVNFLKSITDVASVNNSTILLPINPLLYDEIELRQIETIFDECIEAGSGGNVATKEPPYIKRSYTYLCEYENVDAFYCIVKKTDRPLLCLTKTFPQKIKKKYELKEGNYYWLSDTTTEENTLNPGRLDFEITHIIGGFLREKGGIVAIDCLEMLLFQNSFEDMNEFLKTIVDIASENNGSIAAYADPKAFKENELALLEKRFDIIIQ